MSDNAPTSLNCPACGAPLDVDGRRALVRCNFCGNVSLLPVLPGQAGAPVSALEEIRKLSGAGNIIDAIRKYRENYGVELKEAKEAVEALQAGRLVTPSAPGLHTPEELVNTLQEVQRLLAAGNKIEAIKIYRQNYDVSLARAKYAIEQIAAGNSLWPEAGFPAAGVQAREFQARKRTGIGLAIGITMAVILFVTGILLIGMLQPGGPLSRHYYPIGPAALIPTGQDTGPDIATLFYDSNADSRLIGLIDGATGNLRWQAANLSGDGIAQAITFGPDLVYAANGNDLLAYRKSDGSLAWQVQMPDRLNYEPPAMLVTAGRVITINADQSIQAYDSGSGRLAWSKRLSGYDRSLRLMGDSLVVIDTIDDHYTYGLVFLNPSTGKQQKIIVPKFTYNNYDAGLDIDSGLVYDPEENAIFVVYDSPYGGIQKINLANDSIEWTNSNGTSFNFLPDGFQFLLTETTLYFSIGSEIRATNKDTGEMMQIAPNEDFEIIPLVLKDDILIVRARRSRGTEKFELWGLKTSTGEKAWSIDLQGAKPIDPPDEMAGLIDDTDWGWTWKLASGSLAILTFQGEPNQLTLETFNPADGSSLGKQASALKKVSGDFYSIPKMLGSVGNAVYFSLEANIYVLDAATGKLEVGY